MRLIYTTGHSTIHMSSCDKVDCQAKFGDFCNLRPHKTFVLYKVLGSIKLEKH